MKTILIVDDEKPLREALYESLSLENFNILQAKNGAECLQTIEDHDVDLILLDIQMPVMSGIEVIDEINKFPEPKKKPHVIALTNKGDFETISKALKGGALHYFIKSDYALDDILEVINKILI